MHVRSFLGISLMSLALLFPFLVAQQVQAQSADEYVADEIVIKLFDSADLPAVAGQYNLSLPPLDQFGTRPIYRLRISDGVDPQVKAEQIKPSNGGGDARVEFAEPNYLAQTPEGRRGRSRWVIGGDAGTYAAQWTPQKLRLSQAHTISRGAGVVVAVLDTGVDMSHPALAGRLVPGFDFVDFDAIPQEEGSAGVNAGYGHGTHVAGLVALVAPEAQIMPVRVLDRDGVGNIWVLAEGLRYAVDPDGDPNTNDGADVINLSLGTLRRTQLLEQIVAEAACVNDDDDDDDNDDDDRCRTTGGAIVVAAAGNSGDSTPQYPAAEAVEGVVAVAASTRLDTLAGFSTRGSWVRLSAPGDQVISTVPGGAYATWSGTSMAAPHVAGVAALIRAHQPGLNAVDVAQRLITTAQPICAPAPARLDAAAALGLGTQPYVCPATAIYLPLTATPM